MDGGDEQGDSIQNFVQLLTWAFISEPNLPIHANDGINVNKLCIWTHTPTYKWSSIELTVFWTDSGLMFSL